MPTHHVVALAILATTICASNSTSSRILNGWYPCSGYTFSDSGSSAAEDAQCAMYSAPLCYPGICEAPEGVNLEVDVFVKRLPATVGNPDTASNVWLLEDGPGDSSTFMEYDMSTLHSELNGSVNVYTMDHRGTGRSTRLDCVAAQVTTSGSPFGSRIDVSEVPACAEDLQIKYGDLASFSVTTAATDVSTFISKYTNGKSTIVYGLGYGTMLVERLMHLAPPEVTGYILDGVITASGEPLDELFYFSKWDISFGEVGDTFLALCEDDSNCKSRFNPNGLNNTLQSLIEKFDNEPNSTCAALVNNLVGYDNVPSFGLRTVLGLALMSPNVRTLIPPVVFRLQRCSSADVEVLTQFFESVIGIDQTVYPDTAFESTLLYNLIVFSELWESPLPSMQEFKARFTNTKISSSGGMYTHASEYCAFTKEKSKTCEELNVSNYDSNGIVYKRDQYWNKAATIPGHASVLLMNGNLNPQTPHKFAESLLKAMIGEKKELVTFTHATHETIGLPCGMKVIASYVRNGGDLARLDKSCVNEMPAFNWTTSDIYLSDYFGTNDAYDGVFNSSLVSSK